MMKASDYIVHFLESKGVKEVFLITGGVIANFIASFKNSPNMKYVCTEHEQAAAMAAEAYSRVTGNIGVAAATSGPGALNLMTGIGCAYFDSIPTIFIAGQVNNNELTLDKGVRQFGFQEADVVNAIKPITKMSVQVRDPKKLRYYLEKAYYVAKNGRPGPVFLDLPNDVQMAEINPEELESFNPAELQEEYSQEGDGELELKADKTIELLINSKRPILVFGAGVKISKCEKEVRSIVERLNIPFTLTWGAMDLFHHDHPLYTGGFGVSTTRAGNFAVQNADLIISIGARLDSREIGSKVHTFGREAKKIVLDIDHFELNKHRPLLNYDLSIKADAGRFLKIINKKLDGIVISEKSDWKEKTNEWKIKYPVHLPEYFGQKEKVNPYVFMKSLSEESREGEILITDAGSNLTWTMQGYPVKKNQQLFSAFGHSPMGYSLPAAIGASFASNKGRIICIIGDGGIQMNIQELQTIVHNKLPIKIFVMNNQGYGIIKQFQDTFFKSKYEASTPDSGYSFPDFIKVGQAYGLKTETIGDHVGMKDKIKKILLEDGPVLCNVEVHKDQKIIPKLEFGRPIEDLSPFLDREEFIKNMIVKPLE